MMEGLIAYERFNALKLHFSTDYDYFKYFGKTRKINEHTLQQRKDYYQFQRLERRYSDSELTDFIVSNMICNANAKWVGNLFTVESERIYREWKKRKESFSYMIKLDLEKLKEENVSELWNVVDGAHPLCLKLYLANKLMIETLIVMNEVLDFKHSWNTNIRDDIIWPDISRLMTKYRPFLKIDKKAIKNIMKEIFIDKSHRKE